MQQTFDLRLATLAERYRTGKTTPRSVLADIRQRNTVVANLEEANLHCRLP